MLTEPLNNNDASSNGSVKTIIATFIGPTQTPALRIANRPSSLHISAAYTGLNQSAYN